MDWLLLGTDWVRDHTKWHRTHGKLFQFRVSCAIVATLFAGTDVAVVGEIMRNSTRLPFRACTGKAIAAALRRAYRPAPIALGALVLASCMHSQKPPEVKPNSTLELGVDSSAHVSELPFQVVFGAPQGGESQGRVGVGENAAIPARRGEEIEAVRGQVDMEPQVSIVFNRPMRALDVADHEVSVPVTMTPNVPGSWRWVGTRGLYFVPETHLPKATSYVVTVPASTRALDGSVLGAPFEMKFSTQRPQLVRVQSTGGADPLTPKSTFVLYFNQPVADAEIKRAIKLRVGSKDAAKNVDFSLKRNPKNERSVVELIPSSPLALASEVVLTSDETLKGEEGPLPANASRTYNFETYGPLRVVSHTCDTDTPQGKCAANTTLSLQFSNPVSYNEARKAITVTPAVKLDWWEGAGDDYQSKYLGLYGNYKPATTYTVRIKGSLRDKYGHTLGQDQTYRFEFGDLWPNVKIGVSGSFAEPSKVSEIPVGSLNMSAFELVTTPLGDDGINLFSMPYKDITFDAISALPGAKITRVRPTARNNVVAKHLVRPSEVLGGADKRGPMAVAVRYTTRAGTPDAEPRTKYEVVQVTDLGVSAKVSRYGALVWVTSLSSGKPIEGAEVRIRKPKGSPSSDTVVRTDKDGMAVADVNMLQNRGGEAPIIIVKHAGDMVYRSASDVMYGWRYGVSTDLEAQSSAFGTVFSERGIYRPGETVKLKGIFRKPSFKGTETPVGKSLLVKVSSGSSDVIFKSNITLNEFGTFATDAKIPLSANLDTYHVSVYEGKDEEYVGGTSFEVAEYRASEFKVATELDKRSYVRGDTVKCTVSGEYLFGAPMSKSDARVTVTRGQRWFAVPNTDEFVTDDDAFMSEKENDDQNAGNVASGEQQLDKDGKTLVSSKLTLPGMRGTERVTCEAEVMDISRQTVASVSSSVVHPAQFYIGLKSGVPGFMQSGKDVEPQIITVDPSGKRQAGVQVGVELIHRRWVTAREKAGEGGVHNVSRTVDSVVANCSVRSAQQPQSCKMRVPKAGYYIIRAKANDARGNPVASSLSLYATGSDETGWQESDDMAVELVPDKKFYEIGQTAKVMIKSPFKEADALVTVERAGVYSKRRVSLKGTTPTVSVPITQDFYPNAYVSVVLVRGRSKAAPTQWNAPDVGAPTYRLGYVNLSVNPDSRRLGVKVASNKKDYRPGDTVNVNIDVKDRAGKGQRAEVTLYAVDEGALMLTGYKTPDLIEVFSSPRPLGVGAIESRSDLAALTMSPLHQLGVDKGFEGGDGGNARSDFRQSAYFNPSIITDEQGKAKVSFKLPESLTTYRIMAVVVGKTDQFGSGDTSVTTSLPLMARPAFPRILRAGDEIEAGLVVSSKTLPKSTIEVRASAQGIELVGDSVQRFELDKGQSQEARFTFKSSQVGDAKVQFTVQGGNEKDSVVVTKKVISPMALEAVALYGSTRGATGERMGDFKTIRPDVGALDISVASTALVGLGGSVDMLVNYPYECTEQLASRLIPLSPLRPLANRYGIAVPKDADDVIAKSVAKIVRRQRGDGGFGAWDESLYTNAWTSGYAMWALAMSKKYGAKVPQAVIDKGVGYMRRYLENVGNEGWKLATAALFLDAMAEAKVPDAGYMNTLFEKRESMPLFAKALLAHAMSTGGDEPSRNQLVREIEGQIRIIGNKALVVENLGTEYAELLDSSVRSTAMVLRALVAAKPNHPMAESLVRGLLEARKAGAWASTQENAYALVALDAYRAAQERETPDFIAAVWLGDDKLVSKQLQGSSVEAFTVTVPAQRLVNAKGSTLAFQVEGARKGTMHYEARLRYALVKMPTEPLDRGMFVQKTMRVVTPEELPKVLKATPKPAAALPTPKGGQLVLVDLLVVASQPQYSVVIDDPIPAGLEPINSRLATSAASLDVGRAGRLYASEGGSQMFSSSWYREELRDDRAVFFVDHMAAGMYHYRYLTRATTKGRFSMPPTRVEAMYQPEIFGRTGGTTLQVVH